MWVHMKKWSWVKDVSRWAVPLGGGRRVARTWDKSGSRAHWRSPRPGQTQGRMVRGEGTGGRRKWRNPQPRASASNVFHQVRSCLEKGGECVLQINSVMLVTNCCSEIPTVEWAFPPCGKVREGEEGTFWADVGPALFLPNVQLTYEPTLCSSGHQHDGCLYFLRFLFIFSSSDTYLLSVHYSLMNDLSPQQRFIEYLCYHVSY